MFVSYTDTGLTNSRGLTGKADERIYTDAGQKKYYGSVIAQQKCLSCLEYTSGDGVKEIE